MRKICLQNRQKQAKFVEEYLVDLNATQATIRAGYSKKTAYSQGQRMLKNVETKTGIQKEKDKRSNRLEIKIDKVVEVLSKLAFSKMIVKTHKNSTRKPNLGVVFNICIMRVM